MARVIINADDFGLDVGTNLAICDAFKNTTISSTSLMANMPGFDHALEQIQIGKIDKKCIGSLFFYTSHRLRRRRIFNV